MASLIIDAASENAGRIVNAKYWGLCVFIFIAHPYMYIQTTFNAMRQCCATGTIILAMYILLGQCKKAKYVLYFALVIVAAQFHRIAYVMLIIPIVLSIKWKKSYWFVVLIGSILANLFGVRLISEFVVRYMNFSAGYINYSESLLNQPIYVAFIVIVVLYLIYHYKDFEGLLKYEKRMIDLFIFSLCFLIVALPNDMFYRVYMIILFCVLPSIPIVCKGIKITTVPFKLKNEYKVVERLLVLYYLL